MYKQSGHTLHWFITLSLFLTGIVSLGGCLRQPEVRIGLIAPLSGDLGETIGQQTVNSAQLAVQEVNDTGGLRVGNRNYRIVLVIEDNENRLETAVSVARKLINQENVVAIVGPQLSRHAIPVSGIAEAAKIPMISPTSTNPETTAGKQYVFRASFLDNWQADAVARFTWEDLNATRAAVLYDVSSAYNRGLAEQYQQALTAGGGEVVAFESYTTDTNQDFSQQLAVIKESDAEVLFLPNLTNDVLRQGIQARAAGIKAVIIGTDSWDAERLTGKPEFDGAFFSAHFCRHDPTEVSVREFNEKYRSVYNEEPNGLVALTYDAFGMLFAAMQAQQSTEPEAIRDGLYALDYTGITGLIDYQETGDPVKDVVIYRIGADNRTCYKTVSP